MRATMGREREQEQEWSGSNDEAKKGGGRGEKECWSLGER